jgi:hypothetical protein
MPHAVRFVLVTSALLSACGGSRPPSAATAPTAEQDTRRVLVLRSEGERLTATTPEAAARWRAAINLPTGDGPCTRRQMPEPGVTAYTLQSTNPDGSTNATTLIVDATGRAVRYSEARGTPRVIIRDTGLTPAQRDSAVRAQLADGPRTIITVDYITGQATANNRDGDASGAPTAVQGSAALFDTLPNLGPPSARKAVVRALCGVK